MIRKFMDKITPTISRTMQSRLIRHNYTLNGFLSTSTGIIFMILIAMLYTEVVLPAYNRNADIITDMEAHYVNYVDDYELYAHVFARKRVNCIFVDDSSRGEVWMPELNGGTWVSTLFRREPASPSKTEALISKATSKHMQDMSIYVWSRWGLDDGTYVRALAEHICNPEIVLVENEVTGEYTKTIKGDHRVTINGPWKISDIREGVAYETRVGK